MRVKVRLKALYVIAVVLVSGAAKADYYPTGPASGSECKGLVIKSCSSGVRVDAMETDGGIVLIKDMAFQKVSEYDEEKKMCYLNQKSGGGLISGAIRSARMVKFYQMKGGEIVPVDVMSVKFPCRER